MSTADLRTGPGCSHENRRTRFEGWPEFQITDVVITPEGVGTKAHIVGRAVEVQALLAAHGQQRTPSVPDLLIAATAELTGRTGADDPWPDS